jgi:hypothetical protein
LPSRRFEMLTTYFTLVGSPPPRSRLPTLPDSSTLTRSSRSSELVVPPPRRVSMAPYNLSLLPGPVAKHFLNHFSLCRALHPEEEPSQEQGRLVQAQPLRQDSSSSRVDQVREEGFRQEVDSRQDRRCRVLEDLARCLSGSMRWTRMIMM